MAIKTAQDILDEENAVPGQKHSSRDEEHEQVDEAYETISKKLENLRKSGEDKEESNPSTGAQDQGESDEPEDGKDDNATDKADLSDDPLDDENTDEKPDEPAEKETEKDALDDVEEEKADEPEEKEEREEKSMEPEKNTDEPTSLNDLVEEESSGTHIPNLRPSQQEPIFNQRPVMNESRFDAGKEFGPQDPDKFFNRHNAGSPGRRSNKWHVLVLILIGIGVIAATVYLLKGQFKNAGASPSPSPEASTAPEPSPSPSPSPTVDRSKYKIRVLNGTPKTGLAASVSAKLKELGYPADRSGNATNSAFERTQIRAKSSLAAVLIDQLIKDLSGQFDAASSAASLKESDSADAEVILGAK